MICFLYIICKVFKNQKKIKLIKWVFKWQNEWEKCSEFFLYNLLERKKDTKKKFVTLDQIGKELSECVVEWDVVRHVRRTNHFVVQFEWSDWRRKRFVTRIAVTGERTQRHWNAVIIIEIIVNYINRIGSQLRWLVIQMIVECDQVFNWSQRWWLGLFVVQRLAVHWIDSLQSNGLLLDVWVEQFFWIEVQNIE